MSERPPSEPSPESFAIDAYEVRKADTLRRYGCPEEELWLTECLTVDQFYGFHPDFEEVFDSERGVVYHHESGEVTVAVGFRDEAGFQWACEQVARHLAREPQRAEARDTLEAIPANRYPQLFCTEQWEQLVRNGRTSAEKEQDHPPVVRIVTVNLLPQMAWVLSEILPDELDVGFGVCDLGRGFPELGYVSLQEVVTACANRGVVLMRDPSFQPKGTISQVAQEARARGSV